MKNTLTVVDRFLTYVQMDTQSDPTSTTFPSTKKQLQLGNLLVKQLLELGIGDAHLDEYGYVYATLPSNTSKDVPVICFCSHMDTSPDCSGRDVKPIIHKKYNGEDIVLPQDTSQVLRLSEHQPLKKQIGNDLITADGTTLLGADNKAGIAEIMSALQYLVDNPQVKHGTIKVLFTPDEEIGKGADNVNIKKLGAEFAYTVDGEEVGQIENETFSADAVTVNIEGVGVHPGFAKNKMVNALKVAADIISSLPTDSLSPETTSKKEGFVHPIDVKGSVETAQIDFIIRSFNDDDLKNLARVIKDNCEAVAKKFPKAKIEVKVTEQYRNMKKVLDNCEHVVKFALEATKRAGVKPSLNSIRGGTDGSRLSFMGLPCPNIFTGGHLFHSKLEWISVQDMHTVVTTLVNLCVIWEEKSDDL